MEARGKVLMEGEPRKHAFAFTYLGYDFRADGKAEHAIEERISEGGSTQILNLLYQSSRQSSADLYLESVNSFTVDGGRVIASTVIDSHQILNEKSKLNTFTA